MENATKALIIAAGVLIGMMIIALAVFLVDSLSVYIEDTQEQMKANALTQFNIQFTQYINYKTDGTKEFDLTIQDVVTAANIAYENNKAYELTEPGEATMYVEVKLNGTSIEKDINQNNRISPILGNNMDKKYKCTINDIIYSEATGRVCSINFKAE